MAQKKLKFCHLKKCCIKPKKNHQCNRENFLDFKMKKPTKHYI